MFGWLTGKKKQASAPKQKRRERSGTKTQARTSKANTPPSPQSKLLQQTYKQLSHVKRKQVINRVRVLAKQHPEIAARVVIGWLKQDEKNKG